MKIYLSPSDQTENKYTYGGTNEGIQCHKIADAAEAALKRCGVDVTANHEMSISKAIEESNRIVADYHISIHTNAYNGTVGGTRIFYYSGNENGRNCARSIMSAIAPLTPGSSDNITTANFNEMKKCNATSVYVECAFHDNEEESKWIVEHTTELGEAIAQGICNHLGIPYNAGNGSGADVVVNLHKLIEFLKTIPGVIINE